MKKRFVLLIGFVLFLVIVLSGCFDTTKNKNEEKIEDLFIGSWQRINYSDILTFRSDGNYTVDPDAEMANWSIIGSGKIMMFGIIYDYELLENMIKYFEKHEQWIKVKDMKMLIRKIKRDD